MAEKRVINRRSAVALLGLGSVASAAHAIEAPVDSAKTSGYKFGGGEPRNVELMASALDKLAAAIRSGDAHWTASSLVTEVKLDDFVEHLLTVRFIVRDEVGEV